MQPTLQESPTFQAIYGPFFSELIVSIYREIPGFVPGFKRGYYIAYGIHGLATCSTSAIDACNYPGTTA